MSVNERFSGHGAAGLGAEWFGELADLLLNRVVLRVAGQVHRLVEVEFYYNGPGHPDAFTHGDALQLTCERWYFHRDGGQYRGGSFKGLDLSFGPEDAYGGILIRTLEAPDGSLINGCSLCVDHLLSVTGYAKVHELDAALGDRAIWDAGGVLQLVEDEGLVARDVVATPRVGLTLKRARQHEGMPEYLFRNYRFLTRPKEVKKGTIQTVVALHALGKTPGQIRAIAGSTAKSIQNAVDRFEEGKAAADMKPFIGTGLKTAELCQAAGAWHALYGADA